MSGAVSVSFAVTSGNKLTATATIHDVSPSFDIPWYCEYGLAVAGWFGIGLPTLKIGSDAAQGIADDLAKTVEKLRAFGPIDMNRVTITTECLTIGGTIRQYVPPSPASRSLFLTGSVRPIPHLPSEPNSVLSRGVYSSRGCPEGDWPYTEYANKEVGTYDVVARMLALPFSSVWYVSVGDEAKQLVGKQGTVSFTLPCHYPQPLASGGTIVTQPVEIGFQMTDSGIELRNLPSDGNYGFQLRVEVKDCLGNTLTNTIPVDFNGDTVEIGGGFEQAAVKCMRDLLERLHQRSGPPRKIGAELWPPVDYPPPDRILALIHALAMVGTPEADHAIVNTILAHGTSFNRAINTMPLARGPLTIGP